MTRLHFVKAARKDYPDKGILKGESYYWWQFAFSQKRMSKDKPRRSQLTQSEYKSTIYEIVDSFVLDRDDPQSQIDNLVSELDELRNQQEERLDNMPDQFYCPRAI